MLLIKFDLRVPVTSRELLNTPRMLSQRDLLHRSHNYVPLLILGGELTYDPEAKDILLRGFFCFLRTVQLARVYMQDQQKAL